MLAAVLAARLLQQRPAPALCTRSSSLVESAASPANRGTSCAGFFAMCRLPNGAAAKVVEYLERVDPDAAKRAKARYACFDRSVGRPLPSVPRRYACFDRHVGGLGRHLGPGWRYTCFDRVAHQLAPDHGMPA